MAKSKKKPSKSSKRTRRKTPKKKAKRKSGAASVGASPQEARVVAVVSPRSLGPASLFDRTAPVTAANVGAFRSEEAVTHSACGALTKLGFRVLAVSETTVSIEGSKALFEEVFGAKLRKRKAEVAKGVKLDYFAPPGKPAEQLLRPPEELASLIEGVAVAHPPEIYQSPIPPLAPIHPSAYRYMFVPDELAVILRAARVHRLGATGRNVVVAMIDTGHVRFAHAYFGWHGYRILTTLLGPGQANPNTDSNGHGTGESANIFAAAPDVRLRPVKGLIDPTGDFGVATGSTPTPQVISNSWGYDIDYPGASLTPYLQTLEAAVAAAVASGIVVVFAGGNGQRGFPGSHPDVISVGGVHVNFPFNSDADLEASSYASSFDSSLYPGRHVPDLCGLTGNRAVIGGAGRAPSLMLPVPAGSSLDAITPSTGANNDGWGLFSGTSAACPQVAGVVALMLERDPTLTPAQVKAKLISSARDVTAGNSRMGDPAGPGPDAATGAGLVDAKWAYLTAMSSFASRFLGASPDEQAEMVRSGQMPSVPGELLEDMIETLRSR